MGAVAYQHADLAAGRWAKLPLSFQLANIGSEVSRSLKWQQKGKESLMDGAIDRALELFDLSIAAAPRPAAQRELCRAREEFCDYFFGGNTSHATPTSLQRYYDQFATEKTNLK